jgi:hypothetical protein
MEPLRLLDLPLDREQNRLIILRRCHVRRCHEGITSLRTFLLACVAAAVTATTAAVILYRLQEPVAVAFSSSAVRL